MKRKPSRYLAQRSLGLFLGLAAFGGFALGTMAVISWVFAGKGQWLVLVFLLIYVLLLQIGYREVYLPYKQTTKVLKLFVDGTTVQGLHELACPFSKEMEDATKKLKALLDTSGLIDASKKQAQYLALQNQINPHFLYNTLEGIRGEALMAGLDNVAEMTEALATFFRYTTSRVEHLVTLEDELNNIESYYKIQQFRFGSRLRLKMEFDDEDKNALLGYCLPKLTLQPIVENAISHGLERKVDAGTVSIHLEATAKRLIITVSDDGMGIEPDRLQELSEKLGVQSMDYMTPDSEKKGGIAILNVNNRIKLLFGEEYGIAIYSTVGAGTDVEVTLPLRTKEGSSYEK